MIFSKIFEVRGTKMKKIQKSAARFDNLKQDFLDDKKYSGTAESKSFLNSGLSSFVPVNASL